MKKKDIISNETIEGELEKLPEGDKLLVKEYFEEPKNSDEQFLADFVRNIMIDS